jgi:2'-5' RNA ligase
MNKEEINSNKLGFYKNLNIDIDKLDCVMLELEPLKNMYNILEENGADCALYHTQNKDRFWINGWVANKTPHITLLYGLLKNSKDYIDDVLIDWKLKEVEIESIGYFNSPYKDEPYYCIIAHIKKTEKLLEGHQRLEFLPHINTFMGYKPHMTICYLNKNQGEDYRDRMIKDFNNIWAGKKLKVIGVKL